jgi:hypothetical protein
VAACRKYLTGHEGTLLFSVGVVATELARPVNDRDFDIALHITFASRAAHDLYQEHARHKQFIAEQQKNWKRVRVFDSMVELPSACAPSFSFRPPAPGRGCGP